MATSPHPCCIRRIPPYGCVVEAQCGHQCHGCGRWNCLVLICWILSVPSSFIHFPPFISYWMQKCLEFLVFHVCSVLNFGSLYFPQNGWTALHRAIVCKKQAITSYLLRESADPFVRDAVSIDAMTFFILYLFFCQYNHYIYLSYFTMFNLFSYD